MKQPNILLATLLLTGTTNALGGDVALCNEANAPTSPEVTKLIRSFSNAERLQFAARVFQDDCAHQGGQYSTPRQADFEKGVVTLVCGFQPTGNEIHSRISIRKLAIDDQGRLLTSTNNSACFDQVGGETEAHIIQTATAAKQ